MEIKTIASSSGNYTSGRTQAILYLVMHYTANNGDTAQNNANYFARTNVSASAHYFVDENEIVQSVYDFDTAWHCGASTYNHGTCRNANSIGIEMCSRIDGDGNYYIKDETVANATELVKALMAQYNIPVANVIRHYDVTGKSCPKPWVDDASQWAVFLDGLETADVTSLYDAEEILTGSVGLALDTYTWLLAYKYGSDLILKLANAVVNQTGTGSTSWEIVQNGCGLSDETMAYLDCYRYGDELLIKLATAMEEV